MKDIEGYWNYEVGPIRPPSEATSLLVRVTRNCPWNQCRFCALYKGQKFSFRDKEEVKAEIRLISSYLDSGEFDGTYGGRTAAFFAEKGVRSVFLQDANTLITKTEDLIDILLCLRECFPGLERVTSYARSQTITKKAQNEMEALAAAGLNRIHIGMESGSTKVLELVKKGATKEIHIEAGLKVKAAGIQLSEYYMPGLGGLALSEENALETAAAVNQINPDYLRIRTFALTDHLLLSEDYKQGLLERTYDVAVVKEIQLMLKNLKGIETRVISDDHILNLLPEVTGTLPKDKASMEDAIEHFLSLPDEEQRLYRLGRRTGTMQRLSDLESPGKRARIQAFAEENQITADNIDLVTDHLIRSFI